MKALAMLALVLCGLGAVACGARSGSVGSGARGGSVAATSQMTAGARSQPAKDTESVEPGATAPEKEGPVFDAHLTGDEDTDATGEARGLDEDDIYLLRFGPAAKPADRAAIAGLLESYFGALARERGALACSLMSLTLENLVRETYSQTSRSQKAGYGMTCAAVLAKVFAGRHRELLDESRRVRVAAVRVDGERALAVLRVTPRLLRRIAIEREGGRWRLGMLQTATLG